MRKLQEIDYKKIEKGFENIEKSFAELNIKGFDDKNNFDEFFSSYYNRI